MKSTRVREAEVQGPVRIEFKVAFGVGPKGRRTVRGDGVTAGLAPAANPSVIQDSTATPFPESSLTPLPTKQPAPTPPPAAAPRVPKLTGLLVLGHHFERLIRDGKIKDFTEIARMTGLSRARVTQIANLTLLPPREQETILLAADGDGALPSERDLRSAAVSYAGD